MAGICGLKPGIGLDAGPACILYQQIFIDKGVEHPEPVVGLILQSGFEQVVDVSCAKNFSINGFAGNMGNSDARLP